MYGKVTEFGHQLHSPGLQTLVCYHQIMVSGQAPLVFAISMVVEVLVKVVMGYGGGARLFPILKISTLQSNH